jgi:hypothetical protein
VTSVLLAPAGQLAAALPVRWRYHFTDFRTARLIATLPLSGVKLTEVLSGVGTADATLSLAPAVRARDPFTATVPRRTCLWAERQVLDPDSGGLLDSRTMWGGIVMSRKRSAVSGMSLKCVSWEGYLARRRIGRDLRLPYSDTLGIGRILIREAWRQPAVGAFPEVSPHHQPMLDISGPLSGSYVDREYLASDRKPILEALNQLAGAGVGGFDWRLDPYMDAFADPTTLRVRALLGYPRLGRVQPADLTWSTDRADARRRWGHVAGLELTEDGVAVNNRVTALGEGQPPDQLVGVAEATGELESGYPLYEDVLTSSTSDMRTQQAVDGAAHGGLVAQLSSQVQLSGVEVRGDVAPAVTSYALGDDATIRIGEGLAGQPVSVIGQIIGRTITPGQSGGTERVTFDVQGTVAA